MNGTRLITTSDISSAIMAGGLRRNATSDEVIDATASSRAATVVAMVLLCTLLANLVQRVQTSSWQCPESIIAIIIGFISSLPLCSASTRPGKDFDTIFFLYLVPPILFESGYSLNQKDFFRNFTAIVLLAVIGTVISSLVAGMGLFHLARAGALRGISTVSPKEGLLFGTLLSATDTVATIAVLRQMGVDPQVYALIFGESVLNDAVAVVLFQTVDSLSDDESSFHVSSQAVFGAIARFMAVFIGSVALGVIFGLITALITKRFIHNAHAHAEVTIMMSMAYLAFIVADELSLSGLMAVFFAGVVMSHYAKYNLSQHGQQTTQHVARTLSHLGELLTFMYFGFTILPVMNPSCESADGPEHLYKIEWGFVFWTLVMCVVSRGAAVLPMTALVNLIKSTERQRANRISMRSMLMMWFCILRGAVAFALSLTIQAGNRRYMIPCIVMVILFTNLVLGQATIRVLKFLKIPIGIVQDDESDPVSPQHGAGVRGRMAGGAMASLHTSQVGRLHGMWRRVDEVYIKPFFGGRKRGAYRVQLGYDDGMEGRNRDARDARDAPMLQAPMLQNGDVQVTHDGDAGNAAFDYVMHTSVSPVLQPMPADAEAANGEVRGKGVGGRRLEDLELSDMRFVSAASAHRQRLTHGVHGAQADVDRWDSEERVVPSMRATLNGQVRKTRNIQNVTSERQMPDACHMPHGALQDDVFGSRDQAVASNGGIHFDRTHASEASDAGWNGPGQGELEDIRQGQLEQLVRHTPSPAPEPHMPAPK
mmetsp:Transcript_3764/g.6032  ORF Transcript_3764/g.6032 Transcript_3764/m.6032 type:complete len:766 (-) Transcript_3764:54-2351(-)